MIMFNRRIKKRQEGGIKGDGKAWYEKYMWNEEKYNNCNSNINIHTDRNFYRIDLLFK